MDSGGIPQVLAYGLSQMSSVSYNGFSISPSTGTANVLPNGQIRFQLPNNALLDMKSSKMTFSVKTTEDVGARLPACSQLFSRIEVKCAGISIYNGSNFNHIVENVKVNMGQKKVCGVTGHKDFLDAGTHTGKLLASNKSETYEAELGTDQALFAIDLGEFSEIQPRLIDTSLLGQLEIILTVNDNKCLAVVKGSAGAARGGSSSITTVSAESGAAAATFEIIRPTMFVNMYSLSSGSYAQAVRAKMSDVGYLSLCYDNTLVFNQTWTGSTRFSLSANSLKRLTAVFRRKTAASTLEGAVPIVGGAADALSAKGPVYGIYGSSTLAKAGIAEYQTAGEQYSLPTAAPTSSASKESGAAFLYTTAGGVNLNWKIQSAQVPNYFATVAEQAELTKHAYNIDEFPKARLMAQYLYNFHAFAIPLGLPETPLDRKLISGLNTNATNAFISLESAGSNRDVTNYDCFVLACTDVILRVGEGKSIEVIN